jgi:RimJ/RimL family protein N-acetyltransferase
MKLSDKNAYYFIGSVNNIDAALIRFDEKDGYAIIGINISPDFRGQKLAHLFLRNGTLLFLKIKNIQIKAYIKKDNIASLKSFEKAGFKLINEITFNNIHSYEYIFEK